MDLSQKIILVTGAGRGIGLATTLVLALVLTLAWAGYIVYASMRD